MRDKYFPCIKSSAEGNTLCGRVSGERLEDGSSVLLVYQQTLEEDRTTNIIERAFKEFRRRTRQMDSLPNEECCLRVVYAISQKPNERWRCRVAKTTPPAREESVPYVRQMALVARLVERI